MMRTESIIVKPTNPQYQRLLEFCHLAKNLYNASLYDVRQHYFETKKTKRGKPREWNLSETTTLIIERYLQKYQGKC